MYIYIGDIWLDYPILSYYIAMIFHCIYPYSGISPRRRQLPSDIVERIGGDDSKAPAGTKTGWFARRWCRWLKLSAKWVDI